MANNSRKLIHKDVGNDNVSTWVTMRKVLILIIAVLLLIGATGIFLIVAFFGRLPLGEPSLRIEFYPHPPWQVSPSDSFELTIGIANDAWLFAWAKGIRVAILMLEGFTSSITGTNECEIYVGALYGGDGRGTGLTVTVSSNASLGNYTITIMVLGENVPEKIFTPQVIVHTA